MRWGMAIVAVLIAVMPDSAAAEVEVAFYSRPGDGRTFPHAFVTLRGTIGPERRRIERAVGFTAVRVGLDILNGPVAGAVVVEPPEFIVRSERELALRISDDRYARIDSAIRQWKAAPQPSYRLDRRNCVHFVAAVARAAGLRVPPAGRYWRDPHGFLTALAAANRRPAALPKNAI